MREFSDCEDRLEAIADLPPSAKLVFKTIQYNERLTHDQLSNRTQLSGRTLRDVIARLRNLGRRRLDIVLSNESAAEGFDLAENFGIVKTYF